MSPHSVLLVSILIATMKEGAGEGELRPDRGLSKENMGELSERHLADRKGNSVKSLAEGLFVRCYGRYGCFRTDGVWTR